MIDPRLSAPPLRLHVRLSLQVGDYTKDAVSASQNIARGLSVTFDHLRRRPVTVQYPYEKLILEATAAGSTTNSISASPARFAFGSAPSTCPWWIG